MSITAVCTSCGRNFFAPSQFAGKRVKCKGCGEVFTVPGVSLTDNHSDSDAETDPLSQLAAVATGDAMPGSHRNLYQDDEADQQDDRLDQRLIAGNTRLAPSVLTFDYPGADDVDKWLPIALIVLGFLLLACGTTTTETSGLGWIAFTRFLVPSALYAAFTFPITLTMIRRAGRELRFGMPPNFQMRCFAAYMPAFVLMTWAQFAGEGFTVVQVFAGILGLGISSLLLWLFFRLREENIGTSVAYGAGGFAAGAIICGALMLGLNKTGALIVTSQHAQASVPVSPFGTGFSWPTPPPAPAAPPKSAVEPATAPTVLTSSTPVAPTTPAPQLNGTATLGSFDPQTVPGIVGDLIDPLNDSPWVGVLRTKKNGVVIESWNTQTWGKMSGSLQLPARPAGNIVISNDGQHLAWVAEFPRLSVQVWSFASAAVVSSVDLDRTDGPVNLVGFTGDNLLMIDRSAPPPAPVVTTPTIPTPAKPSVPVAQATSPKPHNIFDDMSKPAPKVRWADQSHGSAGKPVTPPPATPPQAAPEDAPPPQATVDNTPPSGAEADYGHQLTIVDVTTGATVRSFVVPPLAADPDAGAASTTDVIRYGDNFTLSIKAQRLAAACKIGGIPSIVQVDLATGKIRDSIKINEIDPGLSGSPTGLAYSNDGQDLAALFENSGSALLLTYDAVTGKKTSNFVYPAGPLEGAGHWLFRGSALCWLDPSPFWLIYGQGIVSSQTGTHVKSADLELSDVCQQRSLEGDRVELLANTTGGKKLYLLQLDRSKLSEGPGN